MNQDEAMNVLGVMGKPHAQGRLARVAHLMRGPWLRGGSR